MDELALMDKTVEEVVGDDESNKKDAKLYSGYSDKDYDLIKVIKREGK